jgi:hypothetical protein
MFTDPTSLSVSDKVISRDIIASETSGDNVRARFRMTHKYVARILFRSARFIRADGATSASTRGCPARMSVSSFVARKRLNSRPPSDPVDPVLVAAPVEINRRVTRERA